jgi:DNA-binding NarL/FixJ family response regulator
MSPEFDWRDLASTSTDYETRANRHKPTEREVLLREVLRLRAQGLRVRDVAEALGLNPSAVEALIYGDESGTGTV